MRVLDLDQGTDAWRAWRHGGLGSSDAPAILGVSHWRTPRKLWAIKTGRWEDDGIVLATAGSVRGGFLEPAIRARYEELVGHKAPPRCVAHDSVDFARASLDGLRDDGVPLEVKAASRRDHRAALEGRVPPAYVPQLLHALLVTGADEVHYASWNGDAFTGADQLVVLGARSDPATIEALLAVEGRFWESVLARTAPPPPGLAPRAPFTRRIGPR